MYETLLKPQQALLNGDFALVYRYARWHLLTLSYFGWQLGIHTVHFMSAARAQPEIQSWLAGGKQPTPFAEISDIFPSEVETKIVPDATAYLALVVQGHADFGGGMTTDTLSFHDGGTTDAAALLARLDEMMKGHRRGPFLRFTSGGSTGPA